MNDSDDVKRLQSLLQKMRAPVDAAVRFLEVQEPCLKDLSDKHDQEQLRGCMNHLTRTLAGIGMVRLSGNGANGTGATPSDVSLLEKRVRQLNDVLSAAQTVMNYGQAHIREYKNIEAQRRAFALWAQYRDATRDLETWRQQTRVAVPA